MQRPDMTKYRGDGGISDFIEHMEKYADHLERHLNAANARIVELQGQLIANAHNQQDNYTYGIRG